MKVHIRDGTFSGAGGAGGENDGVCLKNEFLDEELGGCQKCQE